uniref:EF-hand calcium-binding domain-containing protein 14 n=1 Tax=Ciona intestinalis TaxID=7719 RepID=H2XQ44_CIOIN|nr:EF-hand calcium-binding domain-containing protein 14 [Ciona intestinalis]|eukprot:XP_002126623.1 EF-hand calcium-binding domain-containing protein 14 [Ciona intestinalis]
MGSHNKRMKKRRELDALLSGGRSKQGYEQLQPQSTSHHADIVFSSSSRDGDNFNSHLNYGTRKMGRAISIRKRACCMKRLYHICLPACMVAMIVTCVVISVGIVWLQLRLKSEVDGVKMRISKLEGWSRDEPASLADLETLVSSMQLEVTNIKQQIIQPLQLKLAGLMHQVEQQSSRQITQTFQDSINTLQQNVVELTTDVTHVHQSVTGLETSTQQLHAQTTQNSDDIARISSLVTDYKQEIESMENKPQRYAMASTSEGFYNSSINAIQSRLKLLEDNSATTNMLQPLSSKQTLMEVEISIIKNTVASVNESIMTLLDDNHGLQTQISSLEQTTENLRQSFLNEGESLSLPLTPETGGSNLNPQNIETNANVENVLNESVFPSHGTDHRVGDTTTSFTELPTKGQPEENDTVVGNLNELTEVATDYENSRTDLSHKTET